MAKTKPENKFSFTLLKRILSYSKPYKNLFAAAIIITLSLSSLSIVRPLLIKKTLNTIAIVDSNEKGFLSSPDKIDFINHMGLLLLGVTGDQVLEKEVYDKIKI